jgi:hypothetical protein
LKIHRTVGNSFELEHCWATILGSFIFCILKELLFSRFTSKKRQITNCIITKVRTRLTRFLKLGYGLCRSCNVEHAATWIVQIHWVFMKISWFECLMLKLLLIDPFDMLRVRLNHVDIVVVLEKTSRSIYHLSNLVKKVHELEIWSRTWRTCENISRFGYLIFLSRFHMLIVVSGNVARHFF